MSHLTGAEKARREGQTTLDSQRSQIERNRLGQFPTPSILAEQVVSFVATFFKSNEPIDFLEPSVGSGVFYGALLHVFKKSRIASALGIEVDPRFAKLASEVWGPLGLDIIEDDFFSWFRSGLLNFRPNLILANPPYSRHHHLNGDSKRALQQMVQKLTGRKVSGLAGLYVYFFVIATSLLREKGIGAWLIPAEFMDVNFGSTIREYLTHNVTVLRIHRFDPSDMQFDDALVTSSVVIVRNTPPPRDWEVEFTYGGSLFEPVATNRQTLSSLRVSNKWSLFANGRSQEVTTEPSSPPLTIGELFKIRRGVATGANSFFIMDRLQAIERGIPEAFLTPILPSPRYLGTNIIHADGDGLPINVRQLFLFDSPLKQETIKKEYPAVWEYLASDEAQEAMKGYLVKHRSPWYKQEHRAPAPFMLTYMGRGSATAKPFRFIWNTSRAIGTNLYLLLYPLESLQRLLDANPSAYETLFAALNEIESVSFKDNGRVYGGGLHKLEPSELANIPLPCVLNGLSLCSDDKQQRLPIY